MKLGLRGEALIKSYETLKFSAYMPTKDDVWTLGYGRTKGVKMGDICTIDQAEKWFREDVAWAEEAVNRLIELNSSVKLSQSMFDALVSLIFNVGPSCVAVGSTVGDNLRNNMYYLACNGFFLWCKQKGKDLLGLARRRAKEMVLFLEDGVPGI